MLIEVVAVPIYGRAESLNVATAAAVCLYATAWAQRGSSDADQRQSLMHQLPLREAARMRRRTSSS